MLVIPSTDANYLQALPSIIDDAEQRIYRELDLIATIVRDSSSALTANSRTFTLPQSLGRFVVTEGMNVYTPFGLQTVRNQLVPVTREWMDAVWGIEAAPTTPSIPGYYAPITDQQFIVGPPPDLAYGVEVIGTIRPTPLSNSNQTTYLTLYLPDLFLAETLIFGYGYLKDFGAMTDDPQAGTTWGSHYKELWDSANTEENRKKYQSQAWTSKQPAPIATPPRA
jgi:hypothetical protein